MEIPPILEIPRAEEGSTELITCKQSLRDRPRDGALPRSSQPIQPVDGELVGVLCPEFYTVQDGPAGSLETTFLLAVSELGPIRTAEIVEGRFFSCQSFVSVPCRPGRVTSRPASYPRKVILFVRTQRGGGTHHKLAPLIVDRHLLHHLWSGQHLEGCRSHERTM